MKPCNPLLKNWDRYLKDAAKFVVLRRYGRGFIVRHTSIRQIKNKARR